MNRTSTMFQPLGLPRNVIGNLESTTMYTPLSEVEKSTATLPVNASAEAGVVRAASDSRHATANTLLP